MRRLFALLIAASLVCGCKGQSPPGSDPFFGRTTVPSPPTGAAAVRPGDPYYRGAPNAAGPSVVLPQTQPGTSGPAGGSGSGGRYDPPGGTFNYRGTSTTAPGGAALAGQPARTTPTRFAGSPPSMVRIVAPEGSAKSAGEPADNSLGKADARAEARAEPADPPTPAADDPALAASGGTGAGLSGRAHVVRIIPARPKSGDLTPGGGASPTAAGPTDLNSQPAQTPTRSIDIMDLPKGDSPNAAVGRCGKPVCAV